MNGDEAREVESGGDTGVYNVDDLLTMWNFISDPAPATSYWGSSPEWKRWKATTSEQLVQFLSTVAQVSSPDGVKTFLETFCATRTEARLVAKEALTTVRFPPETFEVLTSQLVSNSLLGYVYQNRHLSPDLLLRTLHNPKITSLVRMTILTNPSVPPETLREWAGKGTFYPRAEIALNPSTPPDALVLIAQRVVTTGWVKDEQYRRNVAILVANNPSTPAEALAILSTSRKSDIRMAVARNPRTPPKVLTRFAKSSNVEFLKVVAHNPSTPPAVLQTMRQSYPGVIF